MIRKWVFIILLMATVLPCWAEEQYTDAWVDQRKVYTINRAKEDDQHRDQQLKDLQEFQIKISQEADKEAHRCIKEYLDSLEALRNIPVDQRKGKIQELDLRYRQEVEEFKQKILVEKSEFGQQQTAANLEFTRNENAKYASEVHDEIQTITPIH